MYTSKFFNRNQLRGLLKTGDVVLPGTNKLPSFSQTGCIVHVDRMAAYLSADDLSSLRLILSIFHCSPKWLIRLVMTLATYNSRFPWLLGAGLRMLEIGLKGATMSLYYSDLVGTEYDRARVYEVLEWDAEVAVVPEDDAPPETGPIPYENPQDHDVARIFDLARASQRSIINLSMAKRTEYLINLKEAILDRRDEILDMVQAETGKSRVDGLTAEIFGTLDHLDYLVKNAAKVLAAKKVPTPLALMGKKSKIIFEAMGTILMISPWNYPFYQAIVPITSAFAAGNTVIFKPSRVTPLKGLVESLLAQVGFDPGWVQVVYGPGSELGNRLIDQRPDKIFFIGSTRTGRAIMKRAAEKLIPVELEMGGKDPMIVFEDCDLERATSGALWGGMTTTGQSCTSVERLYVQETVYPRFKAILSEKAQSLSISTDKDGTSDTGPMTTPGQVRIIAEQVAQAKEMGATFLTGGDWDGTSPRIPPMIVEGCTREMDLLAEETFGPIIPIIPFSSETEAVELANQGPYGLSASVWSKDLERAERVARQIVTGNVSINNVMLTEGNHALPFGGAKESGIGRYKGEFGLHAMSNIKSVLIDKDSNKQEANWFPYTPRKLQLLDSLTVNLYRPGLWSTIKGAVVGMRLESYVKKLSKKG